MLKYGKILSVAEYVQCATVAQLVEQLVTAGITTVAALISWWSNNSFTAAAIQADKYLEDKKSQVNK